MKLSTALVLAVASLGLTSATAIPDSDDPSIALKERSDDPSFLEEGSDDSALLEERSDDSVQVLEERGCINSGVDWGSQRRRARDGAFKACSDHFNGKYSKGNKRSKCYNLDDNKYVTFYISLTGPSASNTRNLNRNECSGGLVRQIEGCRKGGDRTDRNWYYK